MLLAVILISVAGYNVYGQDPVLDQHLAIECNKCDIPEIFGKIEKHINHYFAYNPDLFADAGQLTFQFKDISLKDLLDTVIRDKSIKYTVLEKQIVLFRPEAEKTLLPKRENHIFSSQITISGRIIDQSNGEPVAFANICVVGKSIGSVSNMQGEFVIKIPAYMQKDTLGISCIGYQTYEKALEEAMDQKIFALHAEYIPIQEVIIRKTDPLYLIKSAIKKIPDNYDINPAILTSFYRETIEHGTKYLSVTESVLETYKSGYSGSNEGDMIKILKGRKSQDLSSSDTLMVKLKAGLNTTLLLDIVKHPADFLQEPYFGYYNYKLSDIISDNNRETYVIDFRQKENVREPLYYGKIYIDVNTLAIKNFEFGLDKNGIEKTGDRFVVRKPHWLVVKPVEANYRVSYREYGHKYYLNLIRCETAFKMRKKKQLFSSLYDSKIEMVITDIDTTNVKRFRYRDVVKPETIFTDLLNEKPEVFWKNYNYIKPDESLEDAIDKISSMTKRN